MFESAAVHPSLPVTVELKETPIRNATTDQRKKKGPLESLKKKSCAIIVELKETPAGGIRQEKMISVRSAETSTRSESSCSN